MKIICLKEKYLAGNVYICSQKLTMQDMSIDTYKLTSTEEPTDEVLSQLMREAAAEARETNAEATQRFFEELRQAAASIR